MSGVIVLFVLGAFGLGMFSDTIAGATNWCWMLVVAVHFWFGRSGIGEGPHREESLCHNGGATTAQDVYKRQA